MERTTNPWRGPGWTYTDPVLLQAPGSASAVVAKLFEAAPAQLRAVADSLRATILELLLERAATVATAESVPAHEAHTLRTIVRRARIPAERAPEFWDRVVALAQEFAQMPRSGDTVYGFAAGLYPTDFPTLPDPDDEHVDGSGEGEA